jgi:hypothetical protein
MIDTPMTRSLLVFAGLAYCTATVGAQAPGRSSARSLVERVSAAQLELFDAWSRELTRSNWERLKREYEDRYRFPSDYAHSVPPTAYARARETPPRPVPLVHHRDALGCGFSTWAPARGIEIPSSTFPVPLCPHSLVTRFDSLHWPSDTSLDRAIAPDRRTPIRAARASVITLLDSAVARFANSEFFTGQQVRLLLAQGEFDRAERAAGECAASAAWCARLRGLVHTHRGQYVAAERAFDSAAMAMSADERCVWFDVTPLLSGETARRYRAMSCDERAAFATRYWWMADPVYAVVGNERRAIHFARSVMLTIHSMLRFDEFFDWRSGSGGDAARALVLRYGWPALTGYVQRLSQTVQFMRIVPATSADWVRAGERTRTRQSLNASTDFTGVFGVRFGYEPGHVSTAPSAELLASPFASQPADWAVAFDTSAAAGWPSEMFLPDAPIISVTEIQMVPLARPTGNLLVVGHNLADLARAGADTPTSRVATLSLTPAPDSVRLVARDSGFRSVARFRATVPGRTAIVEVASVSRGQAEHWTRVRLGFEPEPELRPAAAPLLRVSLPVLVAVDPGLDELSSEPDSLFARVLGSRTLPAGGKVGVYWETYGATPVEPVDLGVWVTRFQTAGLGRRIGRLIGLARDSDRPVVTTWRASPADREIKLGDGTVPIVARKVVLDLSGLVPGEYFVEVAAAPPDGEPVRRGVRVVVQ